MGHPQILLKSAFLHPPQAYELGRLLAQESEGRQVFVTTHSADLLRGVLSTDAEISIIHLRRKGKDRVTVPHFVGPERIRELANEPAYRYSSLLEGLFHDVVVLCEADGDCAYYEAIHEHGETEPGGQRRPDALFVDCGGKAAFARTVKLLASMGIPWRVVADLDVVLSTNELSALVTEANGDAEKAAALSKRIIGGVTLLAGKPPALAKVRSDVDTVFAACTDLVLTRDVESAVRGLVTVPSGSAALKRGGMPALPPGNIFNDAQELLALLRRLGVFPVPWGELEMSDKSIGGKGLQWVRRKLELVHSRQSSFSPEVCEFVRRVVTVGDPTSSPAPATTAEQASPRSGSVRWRYNYVSPALFALTMFLRSNAVWLFALLSIILAVRVRSCTPVPQAAAPPQTIIIQQGAR